MKDENQDREKRVFFSNLLIAAFVIGLIVVYITHIDEYRLLSVGALIAQDRNFTMDYIFSLQFELGIVFMFLLAAVFVRFPPKMEDEE